MAAAPDASPAIQNPAYRPADTSFPFCRGMPALLRGAWFDKLRKLTMRGAGVGRVRFPGMAVDSLSFQSLLQTLDVASVFGEVMP